MQQRITDRLLTWYGANGRDLPWRKTRDPYRIWLSEVILQQTRVEQGLSYYNRFIEHFDNVYALAAASEDEVLKLWQGLGYYSRARNLHAAAKQVVEQFGGDFPADYDGLRSLRGVGTYTAAAIASMAFDLPYAVVDGNVYRVLARLFDLATPIDSTEGSRSFAELAQSLLDPRHAATYNQAIMDFGACCCKPQHPICEKCPLSDCCLALAAGTVHERPVKQGRTKLRDRYFHYLYLCDGTHVLLHRRASGDIWQGLYEFPLIETTEACSVEALLASEEFRQTIGLQPMRLVATHTMPVHQLSHQRIHATFYRIEVAQLPHHEPFITIKQDAIGDYAISRLTERYLDTYTDDR